MLILGLVLQWLQSIKLQLLIASPVLTLHVRGPIFRAAFNLLTSLDDSSNLTIWTMYVLVRQIFPL